MTETFDSFPNQPDPVQVIASCSLCSRFPEDARRELSAESFLAYVARGDTIWTAGSEARFFAIVADGILRFTRRSPQGKDIVVEVLGPGSAAGILPVISNGTYPLTAVAVTNSWYLKVSKQTWQSLVAKDRSLGDSAIAELSSKLLEEYDLLAGMLAGDVEQRLAMALLRVTQLFNRRRKATTAVPITRQGLAEIACTTAESAIRVTSKWQKLGWIRSSHRSLLILDEPSLRGAVDHLVSAK